MNQENANYEDALKVTSEIARGVLDKSTFVDTSMYDSYKDLRNYFRKTGLVLSTTMESEVANIYGSVGEFRKQNFGRLRIKSEGTTLDQVWGDLCEKYPELFRENVNEGEMITTVFDTLDGLQPQVMNVHGEDMEQASYDMSLELYKELSQVPVRETFADQKEKEKYLAVRKVQKDFEKKLVDFRMACRKQYDTNMKIGRDEFMEYKQRMIKNAYGEIRDLTNIKNTVTSDELLTRYEREIAKKQNYIERLKKSNDKKIAELKLQHRQSRAKESEKRKQTEQKNRIRKLHNKMRQMLLKPKQNDYVPKDLVKAAVEVCETVNLGAREGTQLYMALESAHHEFNELQRDTDYNFASEYDGGIA